jgi:hypothetical protein
LMSSNESAVYYPEELSLLGRVLDQVVDSLPPNLRTPYNRVAIAKNILACSLAGERDPEVLRRAALMKFDIRCGGVTGPINVVGLPSGTIHIPMR